MNEPFHVLVRDGDATRDVDAAVVRYPSTTDAGLHRYFFVSRANQTVVMTTSANAPLANDLRRASGWREPGADEPDGAIAPPGDEA